MTYDVKNATADDLQHVLRSAPKDWTVVAIVPRGTTGNEYMVVFQHS